MTNNCQTSMASSTTDDDIIIQQIRSSHFATNQQLTFKQTTDQSQLSDRGRNWRRIETVSIQKISCATHQKLSNLPSQIGNFVMQQSNCAKKLPTFVVCLTWTLVHQ